MISGLASVLTDNLPIKLLAVLLGLVVYAHVYTEREQESRRNVPLRITGLHEGLVLTENPPPVVSISLRGKGKDIFFKLRIEPPEIVMDLSGFRPGEIQRMLSPTDVVLPPGTDVTVTEIVDPRMVVFAIDTLVTREVPVSPVLTGELPEGTLLLGPPEVRPSRIAATGPASVVGGIEILKTRPLEVEELKEDLDREMDVEQPAGVDLDPSRVTVGLRVARRETRVLDTVPVRVRRLGPGLAARVEPDTARVAIWGVRASLDSLRQRDVFLELDAAQLGVGRHLLAPDLHLPRPSSVRLRWARPARFLVEIGRRGR